MPDLGAAVHLPDLGAAVHLFTISASVRGSDLITLCVAKRPETHKSNRPAQLFPNGTAQTNHIR